nr:PASTA domain-containing protein [Agromyces protaetiae]
MVSAGPVPDLAGLSRTDATAAVEAVHLKLHELDAQFDNSGAVAADHVLSATPTTDPVRPGDSIDVVFSKGQDLVDVPNVVDMKLGDAIETLEAAGFKVSHSFPAPFIGFVTVTSQEPAGATQALRGSEVRLVGTLTL